MHRLNLNQRFCYTHQSHWIVWCWWHGGKEGLGFFVHKQPYYSADNYPPVFKLYISLSFCVLLSILFTYFFTFYIELICRVSRLSEQPAGETWQTWDYEGVPAVYWMWRLACGSKEQTKVPRCNNTDAWLMLNEGDDEDEKHELSLMNDC